MVEKNKKRILIIGSAAVVVIGGSTLFYFYTTNAKYQKFMEQARQAYDDKNIQKQKKLLDMQLL